MGKYIGVVNQVSHKRVADSCNGLSACKAHKQQNARAAAWLPDILLIDTQSN